jgi:hypothetical protein
MWKSPRLCRCIASRVVSCGGFGDGEGNIGKLVVEEKFSEGG